MSVQEFIDYFNGIYCDYDGAYGDQCFDLANGYSRWIGGPRFTGATADLIINQAGTFYTRIDNTADNFPQKGDVVVWSWPHVAVATGDNTDSNKFDALEQNDPTGSDCHLKSYGYSGVLGWLRPNKLPQETDQKTLDDLRTARDANWNLYQAELQKNTDLTKKAGDLQNENTGLKTQISQVNQSNSNLADELKKKGEEDSTAIDAGLNAEVALKDAQKVIESHYKHFGVAGEAGYQQAITNLEKPNDEAAKQVTQTMDQMWANLNKAKPLSFLDKLRLLFS